MAMHGKVAKCISAMGAGRKKKTLHLKEKPQPYYTVNCSVPARNLRKSDLGAVIFGCKHNTIKECLLKQLFGLPAPHYAYVKNIHPGLILFLFNYSDRKLHGIFEAESAGQLEINPHGWTTDSTMSTPYPAQVQVRIKQQCCPLPEHVFRPLIADNYYEARLFWFELDRAQTNKLISLFSSSPLVAPAPSSQNTTRWNTLFHPVPALESRERDDDIENLVSEANNTSSDHTIEWTCDASSLPTQNISEPSVGAEAVAGNQKFIPQRPYSSVVSNVSTSVPEKTSQPEKKWSALFETSSAYDTMRKDERLRMQVTNPISLPPDQSDIGWESSHGAPCLDRENSHASEACEDELTVGKYDEDLDLESCLYSSALKESAEFLPPNTSVANTLTAETRDGGQHFKTVDLPLLDCSNLAVGSSTLLDGERQPSESSLGYDANEICDDSREGPLHQKTNSEYSYSSTTTNEMNFEENHESDTSQPFWTADQHAEQRCSSAAKMVTEMKSSDLQTAVIKLMQEIEGLKGSQLKQIMKIDTLEKELVESKVEVQQLKTRCTALESGSFPAHEVSNFQASNEVLAKTDDSILIVGGYDGSSWLSALDSYSPSCDTMKSLSAMTFLRSHASAAKLNGELYIFGGVDDHVWFDTVESYNPTSNIWCSRPSLKQKKGSMAGASSHGKIFAIGGGNGVKCFSEVEMFDPNIGRWIATRSMQQKRFSPATTEINNALYVVGGYNGRNYTKSAERFDPREHSWTGVGSMSSRRGCHSLVALNQKLYALGGYDGSKMVSTVEAFDPRMGSWMPGEAMNDSRGYFGAVVIGESIYVIGGLNEREEILNTIECYKEGSGWEVTNLKAVGKRCFFSTLL
ncbi:hypothetical protein RJ640_026301, partial [Escallonia rubra]